MCLNQVCFCAHTSCGSGSQKEVSLLCRWYVDRIAHLTSVNTHHDMESYHKTVLRCYKTEYIAGTIKSHEFGKIGHSKFQRKALDYIDFPVVVYFL